MTDQLTLDFVRSRRDDGIERAAMSSGAAWQDKALASVRDYAQSNELFLTESVRFAVPQLDAPPDLRAWGQVMRRAAKEGICERVGFARAKSSNLSPKPLWRSLILNHVVVTAEDFE